MRANSCKAGARKYFSTTESLLEIRLKYLQLKRSKSGTIRYRDIHRIATKEIGLLLELPKLKNCRALYESFLANG